VVLLTEGTAAGGGIGGFYKQEISLTQRDLAARIDDGNTKPILAPFLLRSSTVIALFLLKTAIFLALNFPVGISRYEMRNT